MSTSKEILAKFDTIVHNKESRIKLAKSIAERDLDTLSSQLSIMSPVKVGDTITIVGSYLTSFRGKSMVVDRIGHFKIPSFRDKVSIGYTGTVLKKSGSRSKSTAHVEFKHYLQALENANG